ncbi:hypothetical protein ACFW93_32200 [Streptomyces canus]|uniref:hypothetical protein n=1 Tax=Streptomyces canus TaxID=58343 RepID=UPI00369EDC6E
MSAPQRPVFLNGQVLGAADLTAAVELDRSRGARTGRYLHGPGIATGLDLTSVARTGPEGLTYVEVTLQPGMAVDGTGREVVVAEAVRLGEGLFEKRHDVSPEEGVWYPVLLYGVDRPVLPAGLAAVSGRTGPGSTRVEESYELLIGDPGDELALGDQQVPGVEAGPGGALDAPPWLVLLGFVQWSIAQARYSAVAPQAGGVARRHASATAAAVASPTGTLTLLPQPIGRPGGPVLTLGLDVPGAGRAGAAGPGIAFGLRHDDGTVKRLLTVSSEGDVRATGTVTGAARSGDALVQSGTAFDGAVLPLPPGVSAEQVETGAVVLHIQVVPHLPAADPAPGDMLAAVPVACSVADDRRLTCRVLWLPADSSTQPQSAPADYLVVAVAAAQPGSVPSGGGS